MPVSNKPSEAYTQPAYQTYNNDNSTRTSAGSQRTLFTNDNSTKISLIAFNAHIAAELNDRMQMGFKPINGSPEQLAIWNHLDVEPSHLIINAVAGSGKTATCVQYASEQRLAGAEVIVKTSHALGRSAIARYISPTPVTLTKPKTYQIFDAIYPKPDNIGKDQWQSIRATTIQIVGHVKGYGIDLDLPDEEWKTEILWIIGKHYLVSGYEERIIPMLKPILKDSIAWAANDGIIDFDDMLWIPVVLNLPIQQSDILFVDESQDLGKVQHRLVLNACKSGRVIAVGDARQAIYQFRGSDVNSMHNLKTLLEKETAREVVELPLSLTRRCPRSHVSLAQCIVPKIYALDNAPRGNTITISDQSLITIAVPGDLILCRTNAPLITLAYRFIAQGKIAIVRGRDIGEAIMKLVRKLIGKEWSHEKSLESWSGLLPDNRDGLDLLLKRLEDYEAQERKRLIKALGNDKAKPSIYHLGELCHCLESVVEAQLKYEPKEEEDEDNEGTIVARGAITGTITGLLNDLNALFSDNKNPDNAIVLSTIHKAKGLESPRVFIYETGLIPHPRAGSDWEIESELNLAYIAVTRSVFKRDVDGSPAEDQKGWGELYFVKRVPSCFE